MKIMPRYKPNLIAFTAEQYGACIRENTLNREIFKDKAYSRPGKTVSTKVRIKVIGIAE